MAESVRNNARTRRPPSHLRDDLVDDNFDPTNPHLRPRVSILLMQGYLQADQWSLHTYSNGPSTGEILGFCQQEYKYFLFRV